MAKKNSYNKKTTLIKDTLSDEEKAEIIKSHFDPSNPNITMEEAYRIAQEHEAQQKKPLSE